MYSEILSSIILWALCISVFTWFFKDLYYFFKSQKWPSVQGKLILTAVIRHYPSINFDKYKYEYTVDGNNYISKRVGYLWLYHSIEFMKKMTNIYDNGGNLTVYYHPKNPKLSVIRKDVNYTSIALWLFNNAVCVVLVNHLLFKS